MFVRFAFAVLSVVAFAACDLSEEVISGESAALDVGATYACGDTGVCADTLSGVGSRIHVRVLVGAEYTDGPAYLTPVELLVTYYDLHGYFDGAESLKTHVGIAKHRQHKNGSLTDTSRDATLRLQHIQGEVYQGKYSFRLEGGIGDNTEILDAVSLAFRHGGFLSHGGNHNPGPERWDSDYGQNYTFWFGIRQ